MEFRKNNNSTHRRVLFLGAWLLASACLAADHNGQIYFRYTDSKGDVVIATQVPREDAARGYEVVTRTGRVLEVVEPELSEEARQAHTLQQQLDKQQQRQKQQQAAEDAELMQLYSSIDEVHRTRQRVLDEINSRMAVINGNIQRLKVQHEQKQSKAAAFERAGRAVPEGLLQELANINTRIDGLNHEIQEFGKEKQQTRAQYSAQAERLRYLLGNERVVERNKELKLEPASLTGSWYPLKPSDQVIHWLANADGHFELVQPGHGNNRQRLLGRWSLGRDNNLVVLYARKEVIRFGKTSQEPLALERRYPVMDKKSGNLYLFWEGKVTGFRKAR